MSINLDEPATPCKRPFWRRRSSRRIFEDKVLKALQDMLPWVYKEVRRQLCSLEVQKRNIWHCPKLSVKWLKNKFRKHFISNFFIVLIPVKHLFYSHPYLLNSTGRFPKFITSDIVKYTHGFQNKILAPSACLKLLIKVGILWYRRQTIIIINLNMFWSSSLKKKKREDSKSVEKKSGKNITTVDWYILSFWSQTDLNVLYFKKFRIQRSCHFLFRTLRASISSDLVCSWRPGSELDFLNIFCSFSGHC